MIRFFDGNKPCKKNCVRIPTVLLLGAILYVGMLMRVFQNLTGMVQCEYLALLNNEMHPQQAQQHSKTDEKQYGRTMPKWNVEFRLDENKNSILQERYDFAQDLLSERKNPTDFFDEFSVKNKTEQWFIYNIAGDIPGAKLSMNQCASLLMHNISKCVMIGLTDKTIEWWSNKTKVLPTNAIIYNASHLYQLIFDWNLRENYRQSLEKWWFPTVVSFESHRHVQAVIMTRIFLYVDMLHLGVNVWMIDSDVVFPIDPRQMFFDTKFDCVFMMNKGDYRQAVRHEYPYSYPFLATGQNILDKHATINNGIVASRATPSSLKLWKMSVDRVLNHIHGDPQHPQNQLLFMLGLELNKVNVTGYPDLDGDFGYFEGIAMLRVDKVGSLPLVVRTISTTSAYVKHVSNDTFMQQVAIHAVGRGGMYSNQEIKCKYFKEIGFWYIGQISCSNN